MCVYICIYQYVCIYIYIYTQQKSGCWLVTTIYINSITYILHAPGCCSSVAARFAATAATSAATSATSPATAATSAATGYIYSCMYIYITYLLDYPGGRCG